MSGGATTTTWAAKWTTALPTIVSGGSAESWSETWAPTTVNEQVSPEVKSASGFRVQVEGPPLLVIVCTPLSAHVRLNDASVTVTGSLKATDRLASSATSPAPSAGVVELTLGA